jgi:hypothetical protein
MQMQSREDCAMSLAIDRLDHRVLTVADREANVASYTRVLGMERVDAKGRNAVRFDCQKAFASEPFHHSVYSCTTLTHSSTAVSEKLIQANTAHLPSSTRAPQIFTTAVAVVPVPDVVTTDFFAFDDSSNNCALQGLGGAVEMGDAVLGMVLGQMTSGAPAWVAIRNASDPQIDDSGLTIAQARTKASQIDEKYGYWTTISSAIACWSTILDN